MAHELGCNLRQRSSIGAMGHQEIEALAKDLFAAVSGEGEKAVIGKNYRMSACLCVRKHHRHSCRFTGDDERPEVFPKALDLGFSDLLLVRLACYFRHAPARSVVWRPAPGDWH